MVNDRMNFLSDFSNMIWTSMVLFRLPLKGARTEFLCNEAPGLDMGIGERGYASGANEQ